MTSPKSRTKAAKAGVEGTRAYTDALNDVIDADNDVLAAEEKLAEARADRDRDAAQNARDLADAQKDLTRALQDQKAATSQANDEAKKYDEALANLSGSAQEFVRFLVDSQSVFENFRRAVQEAFFANFNDSFFTNLVPILNSIQGPLEATARIMGVMGSQVLDKLAEGFVDAEGNVFGLAEALQQGNVILSYFTREGENGQSAMANLVDIFLALWKAIGPVTERFANWLSVLSGKGAEGMSNNLQQVEDFFTRAGDRAAQFGEIFGHIFDLFGTLADAAAPAIDTLLQYFSSAFEGMATDAENNIGAIGNFFNGVVNNLQPVLDFFGKLTLIFLKMGADKSVSDTFTRLQDALPGIEKMVESFSSLGPTLADIVVNVVDFIAALTDSGSMQAFLDVFKDVTGFLARAAESPFFQKILLAVGPFLAMGKAIKLVQMGLQLVGKVILGYVLQFSGALLKLGTSMKLFKGGKITSKITSKAADAKEFKGMTKGDSAIVREIRAAAIKICSCLGKPGAAAASRAGGAAAAASASTQQRVAAGGAASGGGATW